MNINIKSSDIGWYKNRVVRTAIFVLAAFSILIIRLFYLQVIKGEKFAELSKNNHIRLQQIPPFRGLIYDRKGNLLVDNRPSFDLSIIPKDAAPLQQTLENLARHINTSPEVLLDKIKKRGGIASYSPIVLKTDIDRNMLAAVEVNKFDLPGVALTVSLKRDYIYQDCAAHLIGYLGEIGSQKLRDKKYSDFKRGDFIGKFGVEKVYENFLRGKRGGRRIEVNAKGELIKVLNIVKATMGNNLYLTIDLPLQLRAEELLKDKAGAVVAIEPDTGEILAMASSPAFNQNDFVKSMSYEKWQSLIENELHPMVNKAVQGEYPPGSLYKIVTTAAGLEEDVINTKTTVRCNGKLRYGNRTYRCWKKRGHGSVGVEEAISQSCDIFFYEVGQRVGVDRLADYAENFGLGRPTGIELDDEASGLVPRSEWKIRRTGRLWQSGETLSVSIGQSYNLVTPLQIAVMISAIANGGIRYRPIIVKKVCSPDGIIIKENGTEELSRLSISDYTMNVIKKGLFKVVNSEYGTARLISSKEIEISGKTGTSQVVGSKEGEDMENKEYRLRPHALFMAYAPSEAPKIAVSVFVEHGGHGSSAAAPIAKEMIRQYLTEDKEDQNRFYTVFKKASKVINMFDRRLLHFFDWGFFTLALILCLVGGISLYSVVGAENFSFDRFIYIKQLIWYGIGLCIMLAVLSFNYKLFDKWAYIIYGISVLLLIYVLIFGKYIAGTRRWIDIGFFSFQPSEFAKIGLIISLSKYYAKCFDTEGLAFRKLILPLVLTLVPFVLIVRQPDLGTAMILLLIAGSLTLFVKIEKRTLSFLIAGCAITSPIIWFFLKDYQKLRVLTFLSPERDPLGTGYHIIQSKIAIGSGMITGKGFMEGTQNALLFLPAHHTDFIFSVLAEEWGFIGSVSILFLFLLLIFWGLNIAYWCRDTFGTILCAGVIIMITWQVVVNIGMTMGLMPVVGIPLPFISYGGSSILTVMISIGILLNVGMRGFMYE